MNVSEKLVGKTIKTTDITESMITIEFTDGSVLELVADVDLDNCSLYGHQIINLEFTEKL